MPRKSLKNTLKNIGSKKTLEELSDALKVDFNVLDQNGRILYGLEGKKLNDSITIHHKNIPIGIFNYSGENGSIIFNLVKHLFEKEIEKRRIGGEVLNLYREINMIYKLSEDITEKIDAKDIALSAIQKASQIITNSGGWALIKEDQKDVRHIIELNGNIHDESTNDPLVQYLRRFNFKPTSEIVEFDESNEHFASMIYTPLKVKDKVLGVLVLTHSEQIEYTAADLKLLTTISLQAATAMETANLFEKNIKEVKAREEAIRKIHRATQRFVPYEFIHSLGKSDITQISLGDSVEREVTVLFTDIRDFTSLSERMTPVDNFKFVSAYNQRLGPIINKNKGFINQYLGDGFMAIFPGTSQDALQAAVDMQKALQQYNSTRIAQNRIPIRIGIGMQTGPLILGITGDQERMSATVISDTVNTAARIEGLSKHYGASTLLSENCKNKLKSSNNFNFRYLGYVLMKGKEKPTKIYECYNGDSSELLEHKLKTSHLFHDAMKMYLKKEFTKSAKLFESISIQNSEDKPAQFFLKKSLNFITVGVAENWEGIEFMNMK